MVEIVCFYFQFVFNAVKNFITKRFHLSFNGTIQTARKTWQWYPCKYLNSLDCAHFFSISMILFASSSSEYRINSAIIIVISQNKQANLQINLEVHFHFHYTYFSLTEQRNKNGIKTTTTKKCSLHCSNTLCISI